MSDEQEFFHRVGTDVPQRWVIEAREGFEGPVICCRVCSLGISIENTPEEFMREAIISVCENMHDGVMPEVCGLMAWFRQR